LWRSKIIRWVACLLLGMAIAGAGILLAAGWIVGSYWFANRREDKIQLGEVCLYLKRYIEVHGGDFPGSEGQLLCRGGLVKVVHTVDSNTSYVNYYLPPSEAVQRANNKGAEDVIHVEPEEMIEVPRFQDFKIKYGVEPEQLRAERGKVLLRSTGEVPRFQDFKIKYGVEPEQLRAERGKVLLRSTGEQVLLIDGPTEFIGRRFYEKCTYELYEAMKGASGDTEAQWRHKEREEEGP